MIAAAEADVARAQGELTAAEVARTAAQASGSMLDREDAIGAVERARKRVALCREHLDRLHSSAEWQVAEAERLRGERAIDASLAPAMAAAMAFVTAHNAAFKKMKIAFDAYLARAGHIPYSATPWDSLNQKRPRNTDELVTLASALVAKEANNALVQRMVDEATRSFEASTAREAAAE